MKPHSYKNNRKKSSKNKKHPRRISKRWLDAIKLDDITVLADSGTPPSGEVGAITYGLTVGAYVEIYTNPGNLSGSPAASAAWIEIGNSTTGYWVQTGYANVCGEFADEYLDSPTYVLYFEVMGSDGLQQQFVADYPDYGDTHSYGIECYDNGSFGFYIDGSFAWSSDTDSYWSSNAPNCAGIAGECQSAYMPGTVDDPVYFSEFSSATVDESGEYWEDGTYAPIYGSPSNWSDNWYACWDSDGDMILYDQNALDE